MGRKAVIAVIGLVAVAGLLRIILMIDFVGIMKRMHGG